MALMPNVEHRLVSDLTLTMSRYDVVCVHTIVGFAPASAAHFSTRASGHIIQSRDTRFRSAANLNGNHRVIAIENEDHGSAFGAWNTADGRAVPAFTDAQCENIAKICAWAHQTHGVPLVLCPNSRPESRGIAYHRQGVDGSFGNFAFGGRVTGGELWSTARGKVCPGDRRIRQLIDIIIPRARVLAGQVVEEDVAGEVADKLVNDMQGRITNTGKAVHDFVFVDRAVDVIEIRRQITALTAAVAALADAVRVGEANDLTEVKMRQLLTDAVATAIIDVDVHIPAESPSPTGT